MELMDVCVAGLSLLSFYILSTYFQARVVWKQFGTIPGRRLLVDEFSLFVNLTREVKYITAGADKGWIDKHKDYRTYGWDIISSIGLWPKPRGGLLVADPHAIKTIFGSHRKFPKPVGIYRVVKFFGNNIVTTEFDEWKRHRKIAAPAFSEKNNKFAFKESVRVITSLYEEEWGGKQEIDLEDVLQLTIAAAFMTISAAGFGYRAHWQETEVPPGHKLSFKQSVEFVRAGLYIKVFCPNRILGWGPTKKIRETRDGFAELRSYLAEMINERKSTDEKGERRDLLSNLVDANEEFTNDGEPRLAEDELIGNIFMFYLAGHETSGHTLAFALNMLAVHQEEQEILYQHIQEVLPARCPPTYEDIPKLNRVTATLNETLRMFPPVPFIPKYCAEDTSLVVGNGAGEKTVFQVLAGSDIIIDTVGLHYNPRYWDDPFTFKPERFLGEWDRDAFIPFSGGARACLGRGFLDTTALAMLTILVQHYKVEPHPKFSGESFERLKERYSQGKRMLTLTPLCTSLVFKKRK